MHAITKDKALRKSIHNIYLAQFAAFKACPDTLEPYDMTRMLTSLMGGKYWSWHVIGITPAALAVFAAADFKRPPHMLQRGHKIDRSTTARAVFNRAKPMTLNAFFKYYLECDQTVIMTNDENKHRPYSEFPKYIAIDNIDALLFPSGTLIGWQHRKAERAFLKNLWEKQQTKSKKRKAV